MKLRHASIGASVLGLCGVALLMSAGACKPPRQNDWRSPPSSSAPTDSAEQPRGDGGTPFGHPPHPSHPSPSPGQPGGPSVQPSPSDIQI
jgi:hypothetical protein